MAPRTSPRASVEVIAKHAGDGGSQRIAPRSGSTHHRRRPYLIVIESSTGQNVIGRALARFSRRDDELALVQFVLPESWSPRLTGQPCVRCTLWFCAEPHGILTIGQTENRLSLL